VLSKLRLSAERYRLRPFLVVVTVIRNVDTRSLVKAVVEGVGHRVIECGGYLQALLLLSNGLDPDLLLLESTPADGCEAAHLSKLLKSSPAEKTCVALGIDDRCLRAEAAQLGIKYLLTTPATLSDLESIIHGLTGPAEQPVCEIPASPALKATVPILNTLASKPSVLHLEELGENGFFLAASPKMLDIHRQVKLLAGADVNVLILGESGTGKEVIAHLIHKHSRRSRYKLQKVNCAALPEQLLESELFGHRQGAFTGATKDRRGKFEQADHSTLLLDEIGEISSHMQAKFLQVLQDGQFARLGGEEPVKVDVRVIAATNTEMEKALGNKTFREDLYYRLSVFTINVPPLRERRAEIPYLMEEMIRRMPAEMKNGCGSSFPSRLMDAAVIYDWRGNVRELRNFVLRTVVMRDSDAAVAELEAKIAEANAANHQAPSLSEPAQTHPDMRTLVRDFTDRTEVQMIKKALNASGWNRRRAAQHLNISYRGLLYKIQQHQLTPGRRSEVSAGDDAR
jgi:two-component system, NtrC family, response regulator AtoC